MMGALSCFEACFVVESCGGGGDDDDGVEEKEEDKE